MEKVELCGLKGIGVSAKRTNRFIPLKNDEEVTFGRTETCTVQIASNMISRKHAVIKKNAANQWTITDNKSLNGIHINGSKLKSNVPHVLQEGDTVQLGVQVAPDKPPEFVWNFSLKHRVKKIRQPADNKQDSQSQDSETSVLKSSCHSTNRKRPADENSPCPSPRKMSPGKASPRNPCKRSKVSATQDIWSPSSEMRQKLQEQESKASEQLKEQQEKLAEMQRLLAERDQAKEKLEEELQRKEELMREELLKQQKDLELQRKKFEDEVKRNYEDQLKDKEQSLLSRLADEKERLYEEKKKIESLQSEMERKLGEKDKDYEERLSNEKDKLDKVIAQKELHQKVLETQLNETKTENEKHKESMLHAKEDILANFTELIETELQCSICSELFVQATSLNCSHSYCALCIEQWMKVKKECPNCRSPITSHIRSIVLDSYIDRMVDHLSEDMKQKRKALVEERKAERAKLEEKDAGASTSGRGRGRGRGRGGARGGTQRARRSRRAGLMAGNPTREEHTTVIRMTRSRNIIRSDSSDDDDAVIISSDNAPQDVAAYQDVDLGSDFSESSEEESVFDSSSVSESSVEGNPGAYYGGYGSCYRCGNRGHWANGCPFY